MKIKIRLRDGRWILAPATPTSHSQLFVTPHRENISSRKSRFSEHQFVVSHKRTGFQVYGPFTQEGALVLAEFLASCRVPWDEIRGKASAQKYYVQVTSAIKDFYRVQEKINEAAS